MAYNTTLAQKVQEVLQTRVPTQAKKMFGGVCHLLNGNMFCGVYKDFLILRLGPDRSEEVLKLPFARPFDITGKKMSGWVMLDTEGYKHDDELKSWLAEAKKFVKTLPKK